MDLNERQKSHLRGLAHPLKPVVMVGQAGLSEAVVKEIGLALDCHELIKVKLAGAERSERQSMVAAIAERAGADSILSIGQMAVFYRPKPQKKGKRIALPN